MAETADIRQMVGLLSQDQVSTMLGVTKGTLRIWRREKRGPAFIKAEKAIFYRVKDVEKWLEARIVDPDADAA